MTLSQRAASPVSISIVIPVLNEALGLPVLLSSLADAITDWPRSRLEIIMVDGGSTDETLALARSHVDQLISSAPGRARQQNAGAAVARHDLLFFLHADSVVPVDFLTQLDGAWSSGAQWGRFNISFDSSQWRYRLLAWLMNWRSRLTGICTGDQGLFIRRDLFVRLGGFADVPLMEDIEISRRVRRQQAPCCVRGPLLTSSRRWRTQGFITTVLFMWSLRWRYFFGASPQRLVKLYYPGRDIEGKQHD